ncbi:MAG: DUF5060 domain-containing protein [Prolixibacteraceae bacterium]|nr:DUF5060 domain-containing protein [Prolixibacteraceae bacterium]
MKLTTTFLFILVSVLFVSCAKHNSLTKTEQWDVFQIDLTASVKGNPFMDTDLNAEFVNGETRISVSGFYDGNDTFRVRFSPPEQGIWTYKTQSNNADLSGKTGEFECIAPTNGNHGPVKIVNTWYLQYADETPFYPVGTTAYQWTSVKQSIQEQTLETLEKAPFNKIRMCVFPKSYVYGNETEPWQYPFERVGDENNFEKPNVEFFQNFDKRVKQLCDMGIQADVILFHPYDRWGYSKMGKEMNERYVRCMIARLSAYRNVWWSLANEWDVPDIKESIDWEGIGTLLQKEDPHHRMRGIHNWYNSEDHFYDHTRPWLTHVSVQTSQFYNAEKWRNQYQKPLMFDEMRYEGDVSSGWGNLTGEEMSSYFWMAGLSGGYGTHGETFRNDSDTSEVRWWAKGGTLLGESPERIAYFKSVLEQTPVTEMQPVFIDNGNPENLNNNVYIFAKPGVIYLAYVSDANQNVEINLPGDSNYQLDIIDTWNMKILEQKTIEPGDFSFETQIPYCALRITRN